VVNLSFHFFSRTSFHIRGETTCLIGVIAALLSEEGKRLPPFGATIFDTLPVPIP